MCTAGTDYVAVFAVVVVVVAAVVAAVGGETVVGSELIGSTEST